MTQAVTDHVEVNPALAEQAGHRVPEQVGMDFLQPEAPCGIAHDPGNRSLVMAELGDDRRRMPSPVLLPLCRRAFLFIRSPCCFRRPSAHKSERKATLWQTR